MNENKKIDFGVWKDDLVVTSGDCFSRGPKLDSQHPHDTNPVLSYLVNRHEDKTTIHLK